MSALDKILPASWRGQIFGVYQVRNKLGRRTALHEYPYKDTVWVEDLGSGIKNFGFRGFLNGPFAEVQHASLCLAMDKAGPGTLTHPSLGIFTGVIVAFSSERSADFANGYNLEFEFIESAEPQFPSGAADTIAGVRLGALNVFSLGGLAFGTALSIVGIGLGIVTAAPAIVASLMALPASLASDAGAIVSGIANIGTAFGPYASTADTAVAVQQAATARAAILSATAAANAAAATGDPAAIAATLAAVPVVVRASVSAQADQVRLMTALVATTPAFTAATDAVGIAQGAVARACSALFRRAAMAELARAVADGTPDSYDAAVALRDQVAGALSAGETEAADAGEDDVFMAISALRAAVVADLTARGASLAPLRTVTLGAPLPALALAQRLYGDGSRADELIRRVRPWHPAFMGGAPMVVLAA